MRRTNTSGDALNIHRANGKDFEEPGITIIGDHNTVEGHGCKVYGDYNIILSGQGSSIFGDNNFVWAAGASVFGNRNMVGGSGAKVQGNSNDVSGAGSSVVGEYNIVTGTGSTNVVRPVSAMFSVNDTTAVDADSTFARNSTGILLSQARYRLESSYRTANIDRDREKRNPETDVRAIKDIKYTASAPEGTATCSVCMNRPSDIVAMPCGHRKFCAVCVLTFYRSDSSVNKQTNKTVCPICKEDVTRFGLVFD